MYIGISDALQIRFTIIDHIIQALKFGGSVIIRTNTISLPPLNPQTLVQIERNKKPIRVALEITAKELFDQIERTINGMDLQKLMAIGKTKLSISIEEIANGQTIITISTEPSDALQKEFGG